MKYTIIWMEPLDISPWNIQRKYQTNNQSKAIRYYRYLSRKHGLFCQFYDNEVLI